MSAAKDIKQGDRLVYAIGEKEYNAVAVSNASLGVHPGSKSASYHVNLVYLDEGGNARRVMAAPLLSTAADPADVEAFAAVEARVKPAISLDESENLAAHQERIASARRLAGWRPFVEDEEVAALKGKLLIVSEKALELAQAYEIVIRLLSDGLYNENFSGDFGVGLRTVAQQINEAGKKVVFAIPEAVPQPEAEAEPLQESPSGHFMGIDLASVQTEEPVHVPEVEAEPSVPDVGAGETPAS